MSIGGGLRYRADGRTPGQMRPVSVELDVQKWAAASLDQPRRATRTCCARPPSRTASRRTCAARARLGHRGVRDAAGGHVGAQPARIGQGQARRPDPRDPAAHRPVAAGRRGHRGHGRAHRDHRLRRAPGRRRHALRVDHRRLRRARPGAPQGRPGAGRRQQDRRHQRRHRGRHAAAGPRLHRGLAAPRSTSTWSARTPGTYVEVQGTAEGKPFDRAQMDRAAGARPTAHRCRRAPGRAIAATSVG